MCTWPYTPWKSVLLRISRMMVPPKLGREEKTSVRLVVRRLGRAFDGCEGLEGSQERVREEMNVEFLSSSVWKPP